MSSIDGSGTSGPWNGMGAGLPFVENDREKSIDMDTPACKGMREEDGDEVVRSAVLPGAVEVLGVRIRTEGLGLDGVLLASVSGVGLASETEGVVNMAGSPDEVEEVSLRFSRLMPSRSDAASSTLPAGLRVVSPSEDEEGVGSAVEEELIETLVMVDAINRTGLLLGARLEVDRGKEVQ